ncbi:hypothetical protein ACFQMF_13815 [Halorubrum rutilum]|uniref:SPW repeat-containing protein n=2 Tax=Halorubrum rutilum TaxID=1364933 RepID=A0ABD6ANJ2_9EURY
MEPAKVKPILAPLGLFALSAGAYWSVLSGVASPDLGTPLVFSAIAGATALGAAVIDARTPAVTAGAAAVGFALAAASVGEVLGADDSALLVGAALATFGVLGYAISMIYHIGARVRRARPSEG